MILNTPEVRADTEADARAAYKKGRSHYKEGMYAEAIVELKKAYELKPHPALLRYMGDAYYKLNNAKKAIEHYKLYLKEAPEAADREKIQGKVKQLELIIGASEEETTPPAPAPAPAPAPQPAPTPAPAPTTAPKAPTTSMAPTGEDKEVPVALQRRRLTPGPQRPQQRDTGTSALAVMKWISVGAAVGGLALGITFNRLAAGKAGELEDAVSESGNKDGKSPQIPFAKTHFDLQQDYKKNQTISLVGFIAGGVAAGAAVILFVLDRDKPERRRVGRRVSVAPLLGEGLYGLGGQLSF
jgi:tetratricopeptide (TPR) repeat protein